IARARCSARLTAGWLSSSREAAAVTLFSSAIAANVINRFKSTCRSFSRRMAAMNIMHEPYTMGSSSLISVSQSCEEGEIHGTRKRIAKQAGSYPGWFLGNWARGRGAGGNTGSQGHYRLQQRGASPIPEEPPRITTCLFCNPFPSPMNFSFFARLTDTNKDALHDWAVRSRV